MSAPKSIRPRTRDAILQSLRAGVVPRKGLEHIQVGRVREIEGVLRDLQRVSDGGSTMRFVIGDYGSGKTFFLHLVRSLAFEQRLVTVHADLSPDRRLQSSGGQARGLYAEMMRNMCTRSRPDGGALPSLIERFISEALSEASERELAPQAIIQERLANLSELVGGYDFAQVIEAYWRGHDLGEDELRSDAVRWLRGEYSTRTEARAALGVRTIVGDSGFHDHLKLMARFARLAGYSGLLVCLDEMVNLYKLTSPRARNSNYERLLGMLNDSLQGSSEGLGIFLAGTPEFLTDTRRGLYSYAALQSRLAENTFAGEGLVDFDGPVLRLAKLTPEELYVLLVNIRSVQASGDPERHLLPDEALSAFMQHCNAVLGEAYFRTPRSTVRAFVNLLAVLEQNPEAAWRDLLGRIELEEDEEEDLEPFELDNDEDSSEDHSESGSSMPDRGDDDLASFQL